MNASTTDPQRDKSTDSGPLVSYVIATYGRPDDLVDAVESVVAQAYEPLELIVVGDTSAEVRVMFEDGNRFDKEWIRFCHIPERTSPAHSKNVGFDLAEGEILIHIDDDAVLADTDATETVINRFEQYDDIGILSFQSQDRKTGRIKIEETPDPPEIGMEQTEPYRAPGISSVSGLQFVET